MNNLRNVEKFSKFSKKISRFQQNICNFCQYLQHVAKSRQNFIKISPKKSNFHWKIAKLNEWIENFVHSPPKKKTIFHWNFEIGAVRKSVNLVDLEKCWRLRLLSLSEASIQRRTSLSKFDWKFIHFSIHSLVRTRLNQRISRLDFSTNFGNFTSLRGNFTSPHCSLEDSPP